MNTACVARESYQAPRRIICAASDIQQRLSQKPIRGECVLVVAGAPAKEKRKADESEVVSELAKRLDGGARLKEASVAVAKQTGWTGSNVYQLGLEILKKKD